MHDAAAAEAGSPTWHAQCSGRGGVADFAYATRRLWQGCQSRVWDAAAVAGLPLTCMTRQVWSGCRHARRGGCGGVASHACQHAHTRRLRQGCLTYVSACAYVAAAAGLPRMCVGVRKRGGCSGVASHSCQRVQRGSCMVRIKEMGVGGNTHLMLTCNWAPCGKRRQRQMMVIKE